MLDAADKTSVEFCIYLVYSFSFSFSFSFIYFLVFEICFMKKGSFFKLTTQLV